jgi:hypothetical protein
LVRDSERREDQDGLPDSLRHMLGPFKLYWRLAETAISEDSSASTPKSPANYGPLKWKQLVSDTRFR